MEEYVLPVNYVKGAKMMMVDKLTIQQFKTMKDMVSDWNGGVTNEDELIQLEREHPDFTFYQDASLDAHIESLINNGFSEDQIVRMNRNHYGKVVEFACIGEDDGYFVMAIGAR